VLSDSYGRARALNRFADASGGKQAAHVALVRLLGLLWFSWPGSTIAPRLAQKQFDAFLIEADVTVIPVTDKIGNGGRRSSSSARAKQ